MTIVYKIIPDGGFVAGDTESGLTSYAYPSSEHADKARKTPAKVASEMIRCEIPWAHESESGKEYDRRNWETLNNVTQRLCSCRDGDFDCPHQKPIL